jgi:hypothetical protein
LRSILTIETLLKRHILLTKALHAFEWFSFTPRPLYFSKKALFKSYKAGEGGIITGLDIAVKGKISAAV